MIHKIALNVPENVLTIKEPGTSGGDRGYWIFGFEQMGHKRADLCWYQNVRYFEEPSEKSDWRGELSKMVHLNLKKFVSEQWLDDRWSGVFPEIEKLFVEYNKNRRKVDGTSN